MRRQHNRILTKLLVEIQDMNRTNLLLALIVYFLALLTVTTIERYPSELLMEIGSLSAKLVVIGILLAGVYRVTQFLRRFLEGEIV